MVSLYLSHIKLSRNDMIEYQSPGKNYWRFQFAWHLSKNGMTDYHSRRNYLLHTKNSMVDFFQVQNCIYYNEYDARYTSAFPVSQTIYQRIQWKIFYMHETVETILSNNKYATHSHYTTLTVELTVSLWLVISDNSLRVNLRFSIYPEKAKK